MAQGAGDAGDSQKVRLSKKSVLAWVAGIAASVIGSVLVAYLVRTTGLDTPRTPKTPEPQGPPVRVSAVTLERADMQGDTWLFPEPLRIDAAAYRKVQELSGTDPQEHDRWFRDRGGVDPVQTFFKVALTGNASQTVRIMDIRPVLQCRAPLNGSVILSPPAGSAELFAIGFDLDRPTPVPQEVSGSGTTWGGDFFARRTITLERGESEVFLFTAKTERKYCSFRLRLNLLIGERRQAQIVDDGGRPFQVSGYVNGNPESAAPGSHPLAGYRQAYLAGVLLPSPEAGIQQVDPATYRKPAP